MWTDSDACYRAVESRDRRFDGMFYTAVRSTGIYCRPSCPARTPKRANVTFHRTAAAAQAAGYRACKRCLPGASPGSPEWDLASDLAGRAMRLIADGVVEREGVGGLAGRLGYSERHLTRLLTQELGAGPLALARAHRTQTARTLIETTDWTLADVAFAAGFASVRQFNDTFRQVYDTTPTALRRHGRHGRSADGSSGTIAVRIAVRAPYDVSALRDFAAAHLCPGVETIQTTGGGSTYARTLRLPHGPATVAVDLASVPKPTSAVDAVSSLAVRLRLSDLRDLSAASERCRRLLDADADPSAVADALARDHLLAPLFRRRPGLRVPGAVDGAELAIRTVLGQQISLKAANALSGVVADLVGEPLPASLREGGLTRLFPDADRVAAVDPASLPMPAARGRAVVGLAAALADGRIALDRSADRLETRQRLLELPGVGPWTADYVTMRALGDPDRFLPTDAAALRVARGLDPALGDPRSLAARAESWRPWRSYALMQIWATVLAPDVDPAERNA